MTIAELIRELESERPTREVVFESPDGTLYEMEGMSLGEDSVILEIVES